MGDWTYSFRWSDAIRWVTSMVGALLLFVVVSVACMMIACLAVFMPEMDD